MRVNGVLLMWLWALALAVPVWAAEPAQLPVAVVDLERILRDSQMAKSAREKLEGDVKSARTEIEKRGQEVSRLGEELKQQAALLSAAAIETKQESFAKKQREFQRMYQDYRENLERRNTKLLEELLRQIRKSAAEVAEANGYGVVLERGRMPAVFVSQRLDITNQVIESLNKKKESL